MRGVAGGRVGGRPKGRLTWKGLNDVGGRRGFEGDPFGGVFWVGPATPLQRFPTKGGREVRSGRSAILLA